MPSVEYCSVHIVNGGRSEECWCYLSNHVRMFNAFLEQSTMDWTSGLDSNDHETWD